MDDTIGHLLDKMTPDELLKHQGFITSLDRYVDRSEAWIIANSNNQIQFGSTSNNSKYDSILISENLY